MQEEKDLMQNSKLEKEEFDRITIRKSPQTESRQLIERKPAEFRRLLEKAGCKTKIMYSKKGRYSYSGGGIARETTYANSFTIDRRTFHYSFKMTTFAQGISARETLIRKSFKVFEERDGQKIEIPKNDESYRKAEAHFVEQLGNKLKGHLDALRTKLFEDKPEIRSNSAQANVIALGATSGYRPES